MLVLDTRCFSFSLLTDVYYSDANSFNEEHNRRPPPQTAPNMFWVVAKQHPQVPTIILQPKWTYKKVYLVFQFKVPNGLSRDHLNRGIEAAALADKAAIGMGLTEYRHKSWNHHVLYVVFFKFLKWIVGDDDFNLFFNRLQSFWSIVFKKIILNIIK